MKKIIYVFFVFFYLFIFENKIAAKDKIFVHENYYIIEDMSTTLYNDTIKVSELNFKNIMDFYYPYIIHFHNDNLYLANIEENKETLIAENAYNAMINNKKVIFESDVAQYLQCKSYDAKSITHACYKLYEYDIETKSITMLDFDGGDVYLNDLDDEYLVYNSIHTRDDVCMAWCSYIDVFSFESEFTYHIKKYKDLDLEMSGNAYIDGKNIYFESLLDTLDCDYTQIFSYSLQDNDIELITANENSCFNYKSDLLIAKNSYLIFKSKFDNYLDNREINYVYSVIDKKYQKVNNECSYTSNINIYKDEIICVNENTLFYKIDDEKPFIDINKEYTTLKERKDLLISNLEYDDNLNEKTRLIVTINSELDKIGLNDILVEICDTSNNCTKETILVNVIEKDVTPPKIYFDKSIVLKVNEEIDINKYGFAYDNLDGKLELEIIGQTKYEKKGNYTLLVKCTDSSNNSKYEEVDVIVYDDYKIIKIYYFLLFLLFISMGIIYIFRFKKEG